MSLAVEHHRCFLGLAGLACLGFWSALGTPTCTAQDVVAIEEHWELQVGGPEVARNAPQVTMVMSPTSNLDGDYFLFSMNHWSYPEYADGGLEVQHWNGDEWVSSQHGPSNDNLQFDDEVVSWVQRLSLSDGTLSFEVRDGESQTWGAFGGQGDLAASTATSLTRLNNYLPGVSIAESGIGYAGNRVSSLILTKLVWWTADGQQHELLAPIDIDTDLDP